MRNSLFAGIAVLTLLSGCRQPDAANETASGGNVATPAKAQQEAAAGTPNAVLGAAASPEQAKALLHERHEGMEDIGDAFKIVGRETKADAPDVAAVRTAAATIAELAEKSAAWFPPGSGPEIGKTRAKAEIWQKPEDFAAKTTSFVTAARAFKATADSGDVAAIKAGAGELGKSCKACHDLYRAEKGEHD